MSRGTYPRVLRTSLVVLSVAAALAPASQPLALPAVFRHAPTAANVKVDFNGDGFADLAVGVWGEDVNGMGDAGAVNVLYGGSGGLTAGGSQLWTQDSPGIHDAAEAGDSFGSPLAVGDFNGDGRSDLAVGVTYEDVGDKFEAGAVNVIYGSAEGLTAAGNQFWNQDSPGVQDQAHAYERFGSGLAAADFNGDGFADLAIGTPIENVHHVRSAGAINVLLGSASGLTAAGNILILGDRTSALGAVLGAGDFNGDGFADLAASAPGEDVGDVAEAGAVHVFEGSPEGLAQSAQQVWTQDTPGIKDIAEAYDQIGGALAVGDLNGDGFADLAIGGPFETIGDQYAAGGVNVIYGSADGLTAKGNQFWNQNSPGIADHAESFDVFGGRLSANDINGDGYGDLLIGAFGEGLRDQLSAGAAHLLSGTSLGLAASGSQFIHQGARVPDGPETGDSFGVGLAADDFNGDGFADVAVGVPDETLQGLTGQAGAVNVLYGAATGLGVVGNQFWSQATPGVPGDPEPFDYFGIALA